MGLDYIQVDVIILELDFDLSSCDNITEAFYYQLMVKVGKKIEI